MTYVQNVEKSNAERVAELEAQIAAAGLSSQLAELRMIEAVPFAAYSSRIVREEARRD